MRPWGPVIKYLGSVIPHSKGTKGRKTALLTIKRIRRGESVFLAAEGEQTWNGISADVMPYTGKLVKGSGASLITYRLEGAYLSYPRWARHPRKGRIYGHPVNVYTPEVLAGMTESEIESAINEDIRSDSAKWQEEQNGGPVSFVCEKGGNAEGLERAVCACPECGRIGGLVTFGDDISCSCGFSARLTDTGCFEKGDPFEYTAEWEQYDRRKIKELLDKKETGTLFSDERIILRQIFPDHTDEVVDKGRLELVYNGREHALNTPGMSFALKEIREMTMVLANRIVFSDAEGYYELKSDKSGSTNLRKYVIAWGLRKE
jgi:1-acyl-sn-glycerol-3-phosphate acyltransferase